jgi:hypothetical protein
VQVRWCLSTSLLRRQRFRRDFETAGDKSDFSTYYQAKMTERYRKGKITFNTCKDHLSTLNALIASRPSFPSIPSPLTLPMILTTT